MDSLWALLSAESLWVPLNAVYLWVLLCIDCALRAHLWLAVLLGVPLEVAQWTSCWWAPLEVQNPLDLHMSAGYFVPRYPANTRKCLIFIDSLFQEHQ